MAGGHSVDCPKVHERFQLVGRLKTQGRVGPTKFLGQGIMVADYRESHSLDSEGQQAPGRVLEARWNSERPFLDSQNTPNYPTCLSRSFLHKRQDKRKPASPTLLHRNSSGLSFWTGGACLCVWFIKGQDKIKDHCALPQE